MKNKSYMLLLADRKKAKMFLLLDGSVERKEELTDGHVPQKVKHGDNTWDAQDKIYRHIEDHLHRHLKLVGQHAFSFSKGNRIEGLIIGSHKSLFTKIEKHLPSPLSKKVKGRFVTGLKAPFDVVLKRAVNLIEQIERKEGGVAYKSRY